MLPDPSNWIAEALSRFRSEDLPMEEWPQYRNRYIVHMTQVLADQRSKEIRLAWR